MFAFRNRSARNIAPNQPKRLKLGLEILEDRNCPAGFLSLQNNVLSGHLVELSGYIDSPNPEGDTIVFSGVASGQTTADSSGYYSLLAEATALGVISAELVDPNQQVYHTINTEVASAAPNLSVSFTYGAQQNINFSGQVADEFAGGLTVVFTGAVEGSTVTNPDGTFTLTTMSSQAGTVQVTVADQWGLVSNTATIELMAGAPTLSGFQVTHVSDTTWTFAGQVTDRDVSTVQVQLTGLPSIENLNVTPDSSGGFSTTVTLQPGEGGTVTAQAINGDGLTSDAASAWIPASPILSLDVSYSSAGTVILSGQVGGDQVSGVTVNFTGMVSTAIITNWDGTFSLEATVSGSGTVTATVTNGWGMSVTASSWIAAAPTMSLNVSYSSTGAVILSGQVYDEQPGGLTVGFAGVAGGSVVTNSDGSFYLETTIGGSGMVDAWVSNSWGRTANASAWAAAAPTMSLNAVYGSDGTVTLTGQVSDDQPSGLTVYFSGAIIGSAVTNSEGVFSLQTAVSASGNVEACVSSNWGLPASASSWVSTAPTISLNVSYGAGRMVTLYGQVYDDQPGGMIVNFDGMTSGSVTTNWDGSFSVELEASALGTIQATTSNGYGVVSNTAEVTLQSAAPQIVVPVATEGFERIWSFHGRVEDESVAGMVITFAGLPSLMGRTVEVQADGTFCLIVTLQAGEEGTVTATAMDAWGQGSNEVFYIVRQT